MCARYSLTKEQITMLIGEIEVIINIGARYNIAPTQIVRAIVRSARRIETVDMQWGFKSAWSKQPLINAKAETIATTAFKQHLHHRCLIPADGFYEWTADRTPIRFIVAADVSRLKPPPRRNNERTDVRCYENNCGIVAGGNETGAGPGDEGVSLCHPDDGTE